MLSLIIPARNESLRIRDTLESYILYFDKKRIEYEIWVITDNCQDNTNDIVSEYDVKLYSSKIRLGKGGAVKQGFKLASGDIVGFVDADGATKPVQFQKLLDQLDSYDGAIGSRWHKYSIVNTKQPITRRIASRLFRLMVLVLLGLNYNDSQCGAKVFKVEVVKDVVDNLTINNFAFDIELLSLLKRANYKVVEVPITWEDKKGSTVNLKKDAVLMGKAVLSIWRNNLIKKDRNIYR